MALSSYEEEWYHGAGEEAGMLGQVVRILRQSSDTKERERKRETLVTECQKLDERMDRIISDNQSAFNKSIRAFGSVVDMVEESQRRITTLKANIAMCKELLQLRRDSLRQLWVEHVENKEMIRLVDRIGEIQKIPDQVEMHVAARRHLQAARLLVDALRKLEGDLEAVGALRELKMAMRTRRDKIAEQLVDELHDIVYLRAGAATAQAAIVSADEGRERSSSVDRGRKGEGRSSRAGSATGTDVRPTGLQAARTASVSSVISEPSATAALPTGVAAPEAEGGDGEDRLMTIVDALHTLDKMPDAVRAIQQRLKHEVSSIVEGVLSTADERLYREAGSAASLKSRAELAAERSPTVLLGVLDALFAQLRSVMGRHARVIAAVQMRAPRAQSVDGDSQAPKAVGYSEGEVWSAIQMEVQGLLCDYLRIPRDPQTGLPAALSAGKAQETYGDGDALVDAASLFAAKKDTRRAKQPLFRFSNSHYAISVVALQKEEAKADPRHRTSEDKYATAAAALADALLCPADPRNITVLYGPIARFTREAPVLFGVSESTLASVGGGQAPSLRGFLDTFVRESYLRQVRDTLASRAKAAMEGPDAFKLPGNARGLFDSRCLVQSTLAMDSLAREVCAIVRELPWYAADFVDMLGAMFARYRDVAASTFRGIIRGTGARGGAGGGEHLVLSGRWAEDPRVVELLRQHPVFAHGAHAAGDQGENWPSLDWLYDQEYALERELLGDEPVRKTNVILDTGTLRLVAHIHESMDWLALRLAECLDAVERTPIPVITTDAEPPAVDLGPVRATARDLQELANSCLRVLRLEIHCHCHHFLLPAIQKSNHMCESDAVEPDPLVVRLNKDLSAIDDAVASQMHPTKARFLFGGLARLIGCMLLGNASHVRQINAGGISKMCRSIAAVAQNITNITMAHPAELERAKRYFELLRSPREEILASIRHDGPQFSRDEYACLMALMQASELHGKQANAGDYAPLLDAAFTAAAKART